MSDDKTAMTLREQCEALLRKLGFGGGAEDYPEDYADIEVFAKQQQAVGLREAIEVTKQHHAPHHWYWVWLKEQCEQRAREREGT